jgi:Fur family transcriptional regulator, ferric uptake regulator
MGVVGKTIDDEAMLRAAGLRYTNPRRIVLEILRECGGRPDAGQIFERAQARDARISLATVYRTIRALERNGALAALAP